jgi:hypothetical protein
MVRKLAGWAVVAFVLFFVIHNPTGAADTAHRLMAGVSHVASGLGSFVTALGSGRSQLSPSTLFGR